MCGSDGVMDESSEKDDVTSAGRHESDPETEIVYCEDKLIPETKCSISRGTISYL